MVSAIDEKTKESYIFESSNNLKDGEDIKTVPHKLRDVDNKPYKINAFSYVVGLHNYNGIVAGL